MISALLSTIQTTLLGARGFLLTSLLPVVLFTIGSWFVDTAIQPKHQDWAVELVKDKPAFATSSVFLLVLVAAYVFSSLNTFLRQLLEGKYLTYKYVDKWIGRAFLLHQTRIADHARRRFADYHGSYYTLTHSKWVDSLRQARGEGSRKSVPKGPVDQDLVASIKALTKSKNNLDALDHGHLKKAVDELTPLLKNENAGDKNNENSKALSDVHVDLVLNIQYETGRLQRSRIQAYWDAAAFPDDIAPTRMGNIAGTLRYYAQSRYGILLDVFWTRLQKLLQGDEKTFNALQDAKIQLDFFVSMAWLCAVFSLVWSVILITAATRVWLFGAVCVGGIVASMICYQLGCQSYVTFAEVVRGAIDLFRFQLIAAYHLPLPSGSQEEERLWDNLASWLAYDSPEAGVIYEHKAP